MQQPVILTVNSGSSSLKCALADLGGARLLLKAEASGIGHSGQFAIQDQAGRIIVEQHWELPDAIHAWHQLLPFLKGYTVAAVIHRIVQGGMHHFHTTEVIPQVLATLEELIPLAPNHLLVQLQLIRACQRSFPQAASLACFDTAFHAHMPAVARYYPLPAHLREDGIIRYGFHGLSYEYILQQLQAIAPQEAMGKVLIAHLGHGASMVVTVRGRSIDTTMGFTPAGGMMMSTRSGDIDPGVLLYLLSNKNMDGAALQKLFTEEAGLKGVSGQEPDVQRLLAAAPGDAKAAAAIAQFCYQARKYLAALAAAANGINTIVFTGGIGEHAAIIRERICENMNWMGIRLDHHTNAQHAAVISAPDSTVTIRVMATNEASIMAQHARKWLQAHKTTGV